MQTLKFDQKLTLQEIITENEQLCASFVEYLASIHAMEAFEFWIEVELYKRILDEVECTKTAKFIFSTYLSPHSPTEINLEGRIRRELLENFSKNPNDPHLFNKAQDSVEMMLKYDCLRVFLEVNKGAIRKSSCEVRMFREKSGSHERLLQRYNSFIKIEKKKVRRESTKKSISGSIRRFTTTMNDNQQPKSIASAPKSNSFSVESKSLNDISEREIKKEGGREERRSEGEERLVVKKRARGKKICTDPTRKWSLTVAETPGGEPETAKGEGEGQGQDMEPEETPGNDMEVEKEDTGMEIETPGGPEGQKVESRANTPNNTDWVAFEKPLPQIEAGSSVWLVGGAREGKTKGDEKNKYSDVAKKEGERRKSSGGLFTCFGGGGGTKKKP